jgi:Spy/CpxP family protein refolding chaperone
MRSFAIGAAAAATLVLGACSTNELTGPEAQAAAAVDDDYSLVVFGEAGYALVGTMGEQGPRPFDGRHAHPPFPAELALTPEQVEAIAALRSSFRDAHADELAALREIFEEARAARIAGATRAEVLAILMQRREIREGLRPAVRDLHLAIRAVFTAEQRAWLDANRRRPRDGHRP